MKILHIITGLGEGGAEQTLFNLVTSDHVNEHIVVSLMDEGKYGKFLNNNGIKVYFIRLKRGKLNIKKLIYLNNIIKNCNPDCVQTWMYHSDLIGGIFAKCNRVKKIFWNIRSSNFHIKKTSLKTKIVIFLCALFSYLIPNKIIINSVNAINFHKKCLYSNKFNLIYNGINTEIFKKKNY